MSKGETFPNLHGQLDVTDLDFQLLDAPSCFSVCLPILSSFDTHFLIFHMLYVSA
jgi:hypothetical protein